MQPLALELIQNMLMCCTLLKVIIIPAMYAIWRKDKLKNLNLFFKISVIWKTVGKFRQCCRIESRGFPGSRKIQKSNVLDTKNLFEYGVLHPSNSTDRKSLSRKYMDMYNTISIKNKVLQQKKCRKLSISKIDKKIYAIKPFKPLVLNSSEIWIPLEIRSCQCTKKNRELRNSR